MDPRVQTLTLRVGLLDVEIQALRGEAARIHQTALNLGRLREELMLEMASLGEAAAAPPAPPEEEAVEAFEEAVEFLDARARRAEEEERRFYYPRSVDYFPAELRGHLASVESIVQVVKHRRKERRGQKRKAAAQLAEGGD